MPPWLQRFSSALADRYRVERELGQGGMATVYLAEDLRHHRPVAIKILRLDAAPAAATERFHREIRIVAGLMHPHIVSLLDSGEADGTLYYVMPYLAGESLRSRLAQQGELPVADTIRIMRGVFSALAYAHAHGIMHRDIKPENILLAGDDAQVADFGIARAVAGANGDKALTGTGIALGTMAYMAPEQAAGDPLVDHRADIYSAGLLWYELLAGRHPFADLAPQQQFAAHFTLDIPPIDQRRADVPPVLAELIARCLERLPEERFQRAQDVLQHIDLLRADVRNSAVLRPLSEPGTRLFRLDESLLDTLVGEYDPRMAGDALRYLDNGRISDVLVCYFNRWCTDAEDGSALLRRTRFRAIAPAMFGFEAQRRYRVMLPMDDHLRLVGGLLDELIETVEPRFVILVGFSAGADLALRLAADHAPQGGRRVHAVLAMSPNVVVESAFASAVLARMTVGTEDEVLPYLRQVVDAQQTLQEWADVSEYLARLGRRFRKDFAVLQQFALGIAAPVLEEERLVAFARWYRASAENERLLRCVFEDTALCRDIVRELQRGQKESRLLGDRYQVGSLVIEPGTGHFDLEDADLLEKQLDKVVARLRET